MTHLWSLQVFVEANNDLCGIFSSTCNQALTLLIVQRSAQTLIIYLYFSLSKSVHPTRLEMKMPLYYSSINVNENSNFVSRDAILAQINTHYRRNLRILNWTQVSLLSFAKLNGKSERKKIIILRRYSARREDRMNYSRFLLIKFLTNLQSFYSLHFNNPIIFYVSNLYKQLVRVCFVVFDKQTNDVI